MKKRLFSLLLALVIVIAALPAGHVRAASASENYDLLAAYINTNGTADSDGTKTILSAFEDAENGIEYYFLLQNLGSSISFQLMVYSLTDPGVDSLTTMNITKTGSTANLEFIMMLYYDGDYVDSITETRAINRASLTSDQEFNVSAGGAIIPEENASELFTATMTMLSTYWDLALLNDLGFGLNGLGFTAFDGYQPVGYTVSGTVTSYGDGETVVTLADSNGQQASMIANATTGAYGFSGVPAGTYTLTITKDNHVTREYTLNIESDTVADCTLNLIGDVNGDGKVNMKDWSRLYNHVTETETLSGYNLDCADVNGDGKVNMKDWTRLYNHITETDPLW